MSPDEFHALVTALDYPMYVVTCADGDDRGGCLVGFATQCSISPPHYLVCISRANHTEAVARRAEFLAVHVLVDGNERIATLFGSETGDEVDKFAQCAWLPGPGGAPMLTDCPNRFVGRVIDRHDTGDHSGYVLEPVNADVDRDGSGDLRLLTYRQLRHLDPGHGA